MYLGRYSESFMLTASNGGGRRLENFQWKEDGGIRKGVLAAYLEHYSDNYSGAQSWEETMETKHQ